MAKAIVLNSFVDSKTLVSHKSGDVVELSDKRLAELTQLGLVLADSNNKTKEENEPKKPSEEQTLADAENEPEKTAGLMQVIDDEQTPADAEKEPEKTSDDEKNNKNNKKNK